MAKRFHDTEIWKEDWFIALPKDYRMLWLYIKDTCDHAGIWKANVVVFNKVFDCSTKLQEALDLFNSDREKDSPRIIELSPTKWFLPAFIPFQYGKALNPYNRLHSSILDRIKTEEVKLTSIRPQLEVKDTPKDKVKDKDKDKDKDKYKEKVNSALSELSSKFKFLNDPGVKEWVLSWCDVRRDKKAPPTVKAFNLNFEKLIDLNKEQIIETLKNSISSGWTGLFPKTKNVDINKNPYNEVARARLFGS